MLIVTTMHNPMKFYIECITSKGTYWNPYSHSNLKGPHKRNTNAPTLYLMHVSFKVDLLLLNTTHHVHLLIIWALKDNTHDVIGLFKTLFELD
jgi:hypothetical protein